MWCFAEVTVVVKVTSVILLLISGPGNHGASAVCYAELSNNVNVNTIWRIASGEFIMRFALERIEVFNGDGGVDYLCTKDVDNY